MHANHCTKTSTVTLDSGDQVYVGPIESPALVRIYRVPKGYRKSGYFVSITEAGRPEEYPACADAEIVSGFQANPCQAGMLNRGKREAIARIKAERQRRELLPFAHEGHSLDADEKSRARLATAFEACRAAISSRLPRSRFSVTWTTAEGQHINLSPRLFLRIGFSLFQRDNALHGHAVKLKSAIAEADSIEELNAVDIRNGWPG